MIGIVCALLGRMLGDVGSYWQVIVGIVLIWVALGMLGVEKCNLSGSRLQRLNVKGRGGAFLLGLAYGVLSGSCTFGFIAGLVPLALNIEEGGDMLQPMAVGAIGGLAVGVMVTLFLLPSLYLVFTGKRAEKEGAPAVESEG